LLNLKDLITKLMPSGRATSSGLIGRLGGREAYLLILLWLMERLPRRTSKAPLNLKDLISVLRSSGQATLSGFVGRQWESIDYARVDGKSNEKDRQTSAQSKGFSNGSFVERSDDLFGFYGAAETLGGLSIDSTRVV